MRLLAVIIIGVLLLDLFCSSEAWFWGGHCRPPSTTGASWANHWDKPFTFACPSGQAMTEIHSIFSSCHKDRVFRFACRRNKAVANGRCHWSHYVNNFDKPLHFKCPYSGLITGFSSSHDNNHEDRRFRFRCCKHPRFHRYHCTTNTNYVNGWRQPLNFKASRNYFLAGAISYHDNGQEDRRWKFETCEVHRRYTRRWRSRNRKAKKN